MPLFSRGQMLALAGALVAFALASAPAAHADELVTRLGPVGPHEPILATIGSKRIIAFYLPANGRCAVHAVIWEEPSADAARIRISLSPGQIVHIDSVENQSLNLQCGSNADTLAAVGSSEFVAYGTARED